MDTRITNKHEESSIDLPVGSLEAANSFILSCMHSTLLSAFYELSTQAWGRFLWKVSILKSQL